jgi:NH3-dependent NAD+ synthetase
MSIWLQQDNQSLAVQAPNTHQLHLHRPGKGLMPVLATFDPNTEGNWIASRIVKRLDFEYQQAKIHKEVPAFKGQSFERTRIFVDLTCGNENRRHRCQHRFYVVNHCKVFDILLGTKLCS